MIIITPSDPPEEPGETPEPQPRHNNNTPQLLIMLAVIAAVGGGAFYYFKVMKPKQGANKKSAVKSELDEFDFDADDGDFFPDNMDEPENEDYDSDGEDEDIPDFTAEPDDGGDYLNTESEDE
jgi:hypothetical protein